MLFDVFESRYTKQKDARELDTLRDRFGERIKDVLRERAASASRARDRKHWQRLARKI